MYLHLFALGTEKAETIRIKLIIESNYKIDFSFKNELVNNILNLKHLVKGNKACRLGYTIKYIK